MIKEDLNLEYKDFLKQYVISPICDYTISFSYKGNYYQFDFLNAPKNNNGSNSYDFISYANGWNKVIKKEHFSSLKEAIDKVKIDGETFEEIYYSNYSELIDIS